MEKTPDFVKGDLLELYKSSELEFIFVHGHCLKMGTTKMIDISIQTIKAWYEQMLLNYWTKKVFLIRLDAVTRATVFNRIDWNDWIAKDTAVYGLFEIELKVNQRVDNLIRQGRMLAALRDKKFELTPEEKKLIELSAAKEVKFAIQRDRLMFLDDQKAEIKNKLRAARKTV